MLVHLIEDWYFDKERSVLDVRIIGIAPVVFFKDYSRRGYCELFWLYYPECVPEFEKYKSSGNTLSQNNLAGLFRLRKFMSTKYREVSAPDIEKAAYHAYVQAIYTSRKIRKEMENVMLEIEKAH